MPIISLVLKPVYIKLILAVLQVPAIDILLVNLREPNIIFVGIITCSIQELHPLKLKVKYLLR